MNLLKMLVRAKARKLLAATALLILLAYIYNESSHGNDSIQSLNEQLLNKLSFIHQEQLKHQFDISKSAEAMDQEIANQLMPKMSNKTKGATVDIREWFDSQAQWQPSPTNFSSHPFFHGFHIENSRVCLNQPVDILVYIHSSSENWDKRDRIRATWGTTRLFHDINVKTIFVLGMPTEEDDQMDIEMEHSIHGDLVQAKFNDTFHNLSYKAITALSWINKHCPQAKTILKADDDIFVDMYRVVQEFIPLMDKKRFSVVCDLIVSSKIQRNPANRWYVAPKYLKSAVMFPPFCSGFFALMTGNMIPTLYDRSFQPEKFVPIDDAYIFGVLTDGLVNVSVTNVHTKISHLRRPDPQEEIKTNGKFELLSFEMPEKATAVWNSRMKKLSEWERSHSLYVKLFETPGKRTVVID